ncbi:MAG: hypothetical protein K2W95_22660 [Candidatus Obscuribacterales bacterium]|nr:hypothetical protein [Candidatus Obscuribacterales bacterium]
MNTETNYNEQALVGKQQLAVKMQLAAQRENAIVAKQQLMVKAGLAARRNSAQS